MFFRFYCASDVTRPGFTGRKTMYTAMLTTSPLKKLVAILTPLQKNRPKRANENNGDANAGVNVPR